MTPGGPSSISFGKDSRANEENNHGFISVVPPKSRRTPSSRRSTWDIKEGFLRQAAPWNPAASEISFFNYPKARFGYAGSFAIAKRLDCRKKRSDID
jgi:hypothetical protein